MTQSSEHSNSQPNNVPQGSQPNNVSQESQPNSVPPSASSNPIPGDPSNQALATDGGINIQIGGMNDDYPQGGFELRRDDGISLRDIDSDRDGVLDTVDLGSDSGRVFGIVD